MIDWKNSWLLGADGLHNSRDGIDREGDGGLVLDFDVQPDATSFFMRDIG